MWHYQYFMTYNFYYKPCHSDMANDLVNPFNQGQNSRRNS